MLSQINKVTGGEHIVMEDILCSTDLPSYEVRSVATKLIINSREDPLAKS